MKPSIRLKRGQRGWFAAAAGFERALGELSDAAFKVFAHVCLRAARADGCLEFERDELARQLGKSRSTLVRCLRELTAKGVCELAAAPNQHRRSRLRVRPEYWPYEAAGREAATQGPSLDASAYVAAVRRMFSEPACVQGRFGPGDERLAADWQRAGVSLATVRRAILLGSVRKSMSLLDRPGGEPVRSLRYFARLVEAVRTESFPASYWQHLELNLRRCERLEAG
jgi:AraC-like DNA-binding protein